MGTNKFAFKPVTVSTSTPEPSLSTPSWAKTKSTYSTWSDRYFAESTADTGDVSELMAKNEKDKIMMDIIAN